MVKHNKNGNGAIRQLTQDQQFALRTIQARVWRFEAQAAQLEKQARAADLEFQTALKNFAKKLGVDLNGVGFDLEKLIFTRLDVKQVVEAPAQPTIEE